MFSILAALAIGVGACGALWPRRPEGLGLVDGRLAPCPDTPNCVSSLATDERHGMEPLVFEGSAEEAWEQLQRVVEGLPRTEVVTRRDDYLHVEFTTALMRFVDDVEFQLDRLDRRIQFRSASRAGYSDLRANRRRMERIRSAFEAAVGERS